MNTWSDARLEVILIKIEMEMKSWRFSFIWEVQTRFKCFEVFRKLHSLKAQTSSLDWKKFKEFLHFKLNSVK